MSIGDLQSRQDAALSTDRAVGKPLLVNFSGYQFSIATIKVPDSGGFIGLRLNRINKDGVIDIFNKEIVDGNPTDLSASRESAVVSGDKTKIGITYKKGTSLYFIAINELGDVVVPETLIDTMNLNYAASITSSPTEFMVFYYNTTFQPTVRKIDFDGTVGSAVLLSTDPYSGSAGAREQPPNTIRWNGISYSVGYSAISGTQGHFLGTINNTGTFITGPTNVLVGGLSAPYTIELDVDGSGGFYIFYYVAGNGDSKYAHMLQDGTIDVSAVSLDVSGLTGFSTFSNSGGTNVRAMPVLVNGVQRYGLSHIWNDGSFNTNLSMLQIDKSGNTINTSPIIFGALFASIELSGYSPLNGSYGVVYLDGTGGNLKYVYIDFNGNLIVSPFDVVLNSGISNTKSSVIQLLNGKNGVLAGDNSPLEWSLQTYEELIKTISNNSILPNTIENNTIVGV